MVVSSFGLINRNETLKLHLIYHPKRKFKKSFVIDLKKMFYQIWKTSTICASTWTPTLFPAIVYYNRVFCGPQKYIIHLGYTL